MRTYAMFSSLLLCIVLMAVPAPAQGSGDPDAAGSAQGRRPRPTESQPPTPEEIEMQKRMAKLHNKERFARLKKDTDQLLELATDLKKSVDAANEETLSLEVIRKAEQIEKLAKDVREKMKSN